MRMHKYLLRPDERREGEAKFSDFLRGAQAPQPQIPKSVDLRDKLPPVWDQGQLGACQSYAIDAIDQYIKGYVFTPSHIFTYYNVRSIEGTVNEDSGGTLSDTCGAVKQYGICDSAIWPNDGARFAERPSDAAYADGKAGNDGIRTFYRALTVDEARQALALGHLPYIGVKVYENFEEKETLETGVIPAPKGALLGGHAMVLAGYCDTAVSLDSAESCDTALSLDTAVSLDTAESLDRTGKKPRRAGRVKRALKRLLGRRGGGYFLVRNSWGTGIGLDGSGYFRMDYAVFEKLLMDMWVIVE